MKMWGMCRGQLVLQFILSSKFKEMEYMADLIYSKLGNRGDHRNSHSFPLLWAKIDGELSELDGNL